MGTSRSALLFLITSQLFTLVTPIAASVPSLHEDRHGVIGSASSSSLTRRANHVGYNDPAAGGGYMLTIVNGTYPAGLGEPLNVILSTESDPEVLVKSTEEGGFLNYMLSAQLGEECLGQHLGADQEANLGDGKGNVTEVEELRWNFGNPYIGTCRETFDGGLHLRYWIQNTTGAYFMAVSVEMDLNAGHDIIRNGYNVGRDYLVGNLTQQQFDPRSVTNTTTFSGTTNYLNYTYHTDVRYVPGLLRNSSDDINHFITVEDNGLPAIDGLVAVLTVKIVDRPASSGAFTSFTISFFALLPAVLLTAHFSLN